MTIFSLSLTEHTYQLIVTQTDQGNADKYYCSIIDANILLMIIFPDVYCFGESMDCTKWLVYILLHSIDDYIPSELALFKPGYQAQLIKVSMEGGTPMSTGRSPNVDTDDAAVAPYVDDFLEKSVNEQDYNIHGNTFPFRDQKREGMNELQRLKRVSLNITNSDANTIVG